ncbi:MAG: hypothetical protein ACKPDI_15340 [Actinomycetota bacterium]
MRRVCAVAAVALLTSVAAACSGSDGTTQLPTTLPATKCVSGPGDGAPTVTFTVTDAADGSAGLSAVTQAGLLAGPVRLVVQADASNADLTEVRVTSGGAEVAVVRGVPAGDSCAVDVELPAGRYTATSGGRSVDFDILP